MRRFRKLPSPAMAVALIALFAALSGGAYAAVKIGAGDIKANAIRSKHIKAKQVKRSDIADGVLPGVRIVPISYDAPVVVTSPPTTRVLQTQGLSLDVTCTEVAAVPTMSVVWQTATDNARASRWLAAAGVEDYDSDTDFDAGETFVGDNAFSVAAQAAVVYVNAAGGTVTVNWSSLGTNVGSRCRLTGYAVIDPVG